MAQIVDSILECVPVEGTDRTRITFSGESGPQTLEFTQAAIEALMPGLLAHPSAPGRSTVTANAISPVGCEPFESTQGLCGLAFNLGDRSMHVAVPRNGIQHVRDALDAIEAAYIGQRISR